MQSKKFTVISIVFAVLLFFVVLINVIGFSDFGPKIKGFLWEDPYFEAYKGFFSWVRNGAEQSKLPKDLQTKLQKFYSNPLSDVRYSYANRLENYAMTDCYKIYFPKNEMTAAIKNNTLSKNQTAWLLHELAHAEQCFQAEGKNYDAKRKTFGEKWVKEVGLTLFLNKSSQTIDSIHDKMPMENAAETKAQRILKMLYPNG